MTTAHINRIATAVPPHDIHRAFMQFARTLCDAPAVFDRMVAKAQIGHRFSVLPPGAHPERDAIDANGFYTRGAFPTTAERMKLYEEHAPALAAEAVSRLGVSREVTHLVVTSCTGMSAPGVDFEIVERCGLSPSVERTLVGFMGCNAAMNSLKVARHIVRSEPTAKVLVVNVELCTLHMQETRSLESLLSFLLFGDGCAAALVSAEAKGIAIDRFHTALLPQTRDLITWNVRDQGFEMFLSGRVPDAIARGLRSIGKPESIDCWAVHPGGRSVLDAVVRGLELEPAAVDRSRNVLDQYGNMSSATVMFVLQSILESPGRIERGCAMAFGPGLSAETMLFHKES